MPQPANDKDTNIPDTKSSNIPIERVGMVSTIFMAIVLFLMLWFVMQFNYGIFLNTSTAENSLNTLSYNGAAMAVVVIVALVSYVYGFIYKFILGGTHDTTAVLNIVFIVGTVIGISAFVTNVYVMQFVNVVAMFENTIGIWYANLLYGTELDDMITYTGTDNTNSADAANSPYESIRAEIASIMLSRFDMSSLANLTDDAIAVNINDNLNASIEVPILRKLSTLKYLVGQTCWLYFASFVAVLISSIRIANIRGS